jgi:hypothetical protein
MGNGDTESDEEAGPNEHAVGEAESLEDNAEHHDRAANNDGGAAAEEISGVGNHRQGSERTDRHDTV